MSVITGQTIINGQTIIGPNVVMDGLVLYFDAANNKSYPTTGQTWTDLSGYRNHGILTNDTYFSPDNNGSLIFDGVDDYVNCGDAQSLDFNVGDFSISVWAYCEPTADYGILVSKMEETGSSGYTMFVDYTQVGGQWAWFLYNGMSVHTSDLFPLSNNWVNIVFVKENGTTNNGHFYINGFHQEINYELPTGDITNDHNFIIGMAEILGYFFKGKISVVMAYNRALQPEENFQNYLALKSRYNLL